MYALILSMFLHMQCRTILKHVYAYIMKFERNGSV